MDRMRNFGFVLKDLSRRYGLRFEQRAREFSLDAAAVPGARPPRDATRA